MKLTLNKSQWLQIAIMVIAILLCIIFALGVYAFVIYHSSRNDSEEMTLHKWDWLAFGVSFVSLAFSFATAWSQYQTQKNTAKITPESQKQLLYEYARHFSANLIIISALREMMKGKYRTHYPSEEHLLKLKVDMSSLHPAIFINNLDQYRVICELQVLFRNFNEEIDVAVKHFTNPNLLVEAKVRDLKTFEFKMGYLTKRVLKTLDDIFGGNEEHKKHKIEMGKSIQKMLNGRNTDIENKPYPKLNEAKQFFNKGNWLYLQTLPPTIEELLKDLPIEEKDKEKPDPLRQFNEHIYVEMNGMNDSGSEKIYLIPFA